MEKSNVKNSENQKIQYSRYIIKVLLPFLEHINTEQVMERELEAKIQGFPLIPLQSIYVPECSMFVWNYNIFL